MKKYTETHEWIKLDDNSNTVGTVGVTDYAQHELGDIVYVELPKVGKTVKAGDEVVVLESTKAAADVYSPLSGTIVEVNTALAGSADLVNKDAEGAGWLFKISLNNSDELNGLLEESSYMNLLK